MAYKHGIEVKEKETSLLQGTGTKYGVQVIIGTCPVHLAADPYGITNVPVKIADYEEAAETLGYSDDWESYTLCQSMKASDAIFQVNPAIYINVLDPARHIAENAEKAYAVVNKKVELEESGVLADTIKVKGENDELYSVGADYIVSRGSSGQPVIILLAAGAAYSATALNVTSTSVDPSAVAESDIIGAYDFVTGEETGLELIRQVYPRFQFPPALLLAPGWSHKPNIAAALQGKCEGINGIFSCECLLDLDTGAARMYTDCAQVKADAGFSNAHAIALWPMVALSGKQYAFSAVYGAMVSNLTVENDDIPYLYPSNKDLYIDGVVIKDGTEVMLDQTQAAELNGEGIVTAINDGGWKSMGNNTAAYPGNTDPKDRWIACRRMFSFVGNYFYINFKNRIDKNMNRRTIDDIVNSFNIWGNSLANRDMCAALSAAYVESKNVTEDIMNGHVYLQVKFAPYTPTEYIEATIEFDLAALQNALSQAEE